MFQLLVGSANNFIVDLKKTLKKLNTHIKLDKLVYLFTGLKRFFACDHDRAIKYFTASVNKCQFSGIICTNYQWVDNSICLYIKSKIGVCSDFTHMSHEAVDPWHHKISDFCYFYEGLKTNSHRPNFMCPKFIWMRIIIIFFRFNSP